jgi:hypothetical protein
MTNNKMRLTAFAIITAIIVSGCSFNGGPRPRLGSYATATPGTNFIGLDDLGKHSYKNGLFETNGILYTCRGGHIDIAHLRIAADYTKYLSEKSRKAILKDRQSFDFKLNVEPSTYTATIYYPTNWDNMTEKQREDIAGQVSIELGSHFAYTMSIWHEVLTWFGYKCMKIVPEDASAFSWEDIYSNLLGARLAARVLANDPDDYDQAFTAALKAEMEYLGVQPKEVAKEASESVNNKWYKGFTFVDMRCRNMDIGTDDGMVTPILIEGICEDAKPVSYAVPRLDKFKEYGFSLQLEITPKEFEKGKILRIIYPESDGEIVIPDRDIPVLVEHITEAELKRGCRVNPVNTLFSKDEPSQGPRKQPAPEAAHQNRTQWH